MMYKFTICLTVDGEEDCCWSQGLISADSYDDAMGKLCERFSDCDIHRVELEEAPEVLLDCWINALWEDCE